MKRNLIIVSFVFIITLLFTSKVYAQQVSLGIYPPIFQITVNPPENIKVPFTIKNYSETPVILEITIKPFRPSNKNDGEITYNNKERILQTVQILQDNHPIDQIILGPQEEKTLLLNLDISKDEPEFDHYFSVLFISKDNLNNLNTSQITTAGIASNVLVSIGKNSKPEGFLSEFTSPFLLAKGPVPFQVLVQNTGKHYIKPNGSIVIRNMFGQVVGNIKLLPVNILSNSSRYLPDSSLSSIIYATWPEKFILGPYTAELTIALSPDGPLFKKTINFIGLPTSILISLIITCLLLALIVYRVKRKLK